MFLEPSFRINRSPSKPTNWTFFSDELLSAASTLNKIFHRKSFNIIVAFSKFICIIVHRWSRNQHRSFISPKQRAVQDEWSRISKSLSLTRCTLEPRAIPRTRRRTGAQVGYLDTCHPRVEESSHREPPNRFDTWKSLARIAAPGSFCSCS